MAQQKSPKKSKKAAPVAAKKASVPTRKGPAKSSAAKAKPVAGPAKVSNKAKSGNEKPAPKAAKVVKHGTSGLSKSDLQYFRNLLLEKRREILGDVGSMESEAFKQGSNLSNMPIHMADVGTDNFEQEFTLGLIESERRILREIQEALVRVDDGAFGVCQGTGKPIPRVRLEAVPWAKYTLDYQKALDSGQIRRDEAAADDDESGPEEEEE